MKRIKDGQFKQSLRANLSAHINFIMLKVDPPKGYPTNDFHHVSTSNLPVGTESWNPTVTNVVVDKPFAVSLSTFLSTL